MAVTFRKVQPVKVLNKPIDQSSLKISLVEFNQRNPILAPVPGGTIVVGAQALVVILTQAERLYAANLSNG
ncbi:MAG: hypothetical protein CEE43_12695 [Promethearchaeota archaeon Loki_b32]|nr:MAG: hypothetical protein CEE43_12695 [Candidatus Lokiarchaeota archaeon Loki_b32]